MAYTTKAPKGFDEIHRILGGAMRAADKATWPARPHLGGPLPVLTTGTQVDVALAIGAAARELAPPPDLKQFDRLYKLAQRVGKGQRVPYETMDEPSKGNKLDAPGLRAVKLVVRTALNHLYAAPSARNTAGTCAENAAVALVDFLNGRGPEAVRGFLASVDAAVLRCDLAAQLAERRLVATSPIAFVVSRARASTKKKAPLGLALAKLVDGRYGVWVKLKRKWEWHEGDRATAFAMVPDAFMEHVSADLDGLKRTRG